MRVFWVNIAKSGVYLRYRHCFKLFRELSKESKFWQRCCRNSTKVRERKRKSGREKILYFSNYITEIPAAQTAARVGVKCPKGNQLWQCHCRKRGKKKLLKSGEELKKKMLRPQYFYNIFTINHKLLVIISSILNLTPRLLF